MYAVLGRAKNDKEKDTKSFSVYLSLLERKFSCSPLSSFCSVSISRNETFFSVISSEKDLCKQILDFSKRYFESLNSSPNVSLELTTSPSF